MKNEKGKNKSVLMVLDSMFEDNSFFKNIKNNTADLRHRCIEKLNIVYMEKGKTIGKFIIFYESYFCHLTNKLFYINSFFFFLLDS